MAHGLQIREVVDADNGAGRERLRYVCRWWASHIRPDQAGHRIAVSRQMEALDTAGASLRVRGQQSESIRSPSVSRKISLSQSRWNIRDVLRRAPRAERMG